MFTLKGRVARNTATDLDDSATIKLALTALGYYDNGKTGLAPYGDDQLFSSIKSFQKDNNLEPDGVINADGPTQEKIKEKLGSDEKSGSAFEDFIKNRQDMKDANTIDADKYFHCK